jgi:Glycolipid 2-alpha-mannosyltransferase
MPNAQSAQEELLKHTSLDPDATDENITAGTSNHGPFYNFLHYLTAAAMLVLFTCGYQMNKADALRASESKSTLSTAFVYLAASDPNDLQNLIYSLRNLDENYNARARRRVVIVHESITSAEQNELQSYFSGHLEFRQVSLDLPEELYERYNLSSIDPQFTKRGKWSYQNMCRFWWFSAMAENSKSPLADVDILIRLDTDSAFSLGPIQRDFVQDFIDAKRRYGYIRIQKECDDTAGKELAKSLKQFAVQYVEMNSIRPKSSEFWSRVLRQWHTSCIPSFANHFEIIDLRYWRTHQGMKDWRDVVEKNGGIYTHGNVLFSSFHPPCISYLGS